MSVPDLPPTASSPPLDAAARREIATNLALALVAIGVFAHFYWSLAFTAAIFVLTLGALVFVHEWGHFQFARWAGMKVNRFGIGFPPWIFTVRRNNIDYSIGALPIGGMVDIAGLGSEEEMVGTVSGEASATRPAQRDVPFSERQFQDGSLGWRFMTLFAGPLMNFVFAIVVFIAVFAISGEGIQIPTTRIDNVIAGSPAEQAGILADDQVVSVNGVAGKDGDQLHTLIHDSETPTLRIEVRRKGATTAFIVTPKPVAEMGGPADDKGRMIGVGFQVITHFKKMALGQAVKYGFVDAMGVSTDIFRLLDRAFTLRLTSEDRKDVGGPIKIAQAAGESAKQGWQALALFAARLSVNLGLINLLPFPALDGGRILFLGYELVAGKPVDSKREGVVHLIGMGMLLAFMLFITVRDILPYIIHKPA